MNWFLLATSTLSNTALWVFLRLKYIFTSLVAIRYSHTFTEMPTIASGSEYVLNLQQYGDADDIAKITKQAGNYTTSQIINSATGFNPVYYFSAIADPKTTTTEQVVLSITEPAGHPHSDSTRVTINFTIQ